MGKNAVRFKWPILGGGGRKEWYLLTATVFLTFLLGELILHMIFPPVYQATKYGWTIKANKSNFRRIEDQPGNFRNVRNEYFDHGFKRWGSTSGKIHKQWPVVLIIGDSFTEMIHVSNGEEWYSYLEKEFNRIKFFVFGGGGYGSLQEYMILDDYIDEINPDLVIWQFCHNDYRNNHYESDRNRYPYNNFGIRPYVENNEIIYKMPMPFSLLRKYSRIADRLLMRFDSYQKAKIQANSNSNFNHQIGGFEKSKEIVSETAYGVTGEILKMARQRAGKRPFFLFSTEPITDKESLLCAKAGITCIPGVSEYLESKEEEGISVRVENDGHWNLAGNRFVGEFLINYFKAHQVINILSG